MPEDIFGQALHASHPVSRQGEACTHNQLILFMACSWIAMLDWTVLSFMKIKPGHLSQGQGSMNEALGPSLQR